MASSHDAYLDHRELIEAAIRSVCRRNYLGPADAEDFASTARLHLLKNDCEVLRAFARRSSFQTYLVAVLAHCFLDWRNGRWGKWRPSAKAKRLGPLAVQLDTLLSRDGLSFDEACETIRARSASPASTDDLARIAAQLPRRPRRFFVSDEGLENRPAPYGAADAPVLHEEAGGMAARASSVLDEVVRGFPPQDRLILKMRFQDDFAVADIARALSLDAKPLYRRFEKLLGAVRVELERAGITADAIAYILEQRGFDVLLRQASGETGRSVRPLFGKGPGVQDSRTP